MGMEIRYDEIEIFRNNISTLKKTSRDDENTVKQYMIDAEVSVIHFDRVKKAYVRSLEPKPKFLPCSSDALYIGREGSVSFIEFKNGKINDKQKYNVYQKIYESLLIFCDITGESISFCRDHAEFILVYNETKNDEAKEEREEGGLQESASRVKIGKYFHRKGKGHFIRFGLERFEQLYFQRVFTYTEAEFENEFVKGMSE
mgnify:FL=1|jgi:hypothetical protein